MFPEVVLFVLLELRANRGEGGIIFQYTGRYLLVIPDLQISKKTYFYCTPLAEISCKQRVGLLTKRFLCLNRLQIPCRSLRKRSAGAGARLSRRFTGTTEVVPFRKSSAFLN